ncbi:rhamnose ABC transporter substrate-binding protein [Ktedonobacter sp. SOSP1-85]|uniref:Rhamnose ABC transporter substrate-binding protein n=1 Tax=Ktedonobacter robiniae TaxID=2778365 RepID=A0ABQ3UX53_9CHLR|nr:MULTISPECIES: rhamnose ABC transporter substrate-binding protein [Ktedonobacter]GHO56967.1 rhamnose ABC transporter substrate-binding protein [Ktedonobacter robiniae]GHO78642.1 rhamnose ABC transporter substrate-binding protein [Ktedonobacter sp. SOSP1-85]
MKLFRTLGLGFMVGILLLLAACGGSSDGNAGATGGNGTSLNVAFLPKAINNPYFDTAANGGKDAAGELKGTFKQVGPSNASASEQVTYINTLTQQHVSAIVVSANDPNALAPSLKRAIQQGIKVVSYDSDVAPDARQVFINQANSEDIGRIEVQTLAKQLNYTGDIAILSAASTATNQNTWIQFMKDELSKPDYKNMKLVKVAYGNDDDQKSFNETLGLLQAYPNLKGIISPTTVGIAAAARAVESVNKGGKVLITGLGTPNQMRKYVKDGTCPSFALWDPGQLGYLAYYAASALVQGKIKGQQGESFDAGKLGKKTIGANNVVLLGPPTVFDKDNIDKFNF